MMKKTDKTGRGAAATLAAYLLWGILPVYWNMLAAVTPLHLLACRILLSLGFVALLLRLRPPPRKAPPLSLRQLALVVVSGLIIAANWGIYIWAVNTGHTVDASLGYYINPLLSIVLGLLFFRERLLPLQWAAFAVACLGVALVTVFTGSLPWISLALAFTFAFYGLLKKKIAAHRGALEALAAETLAAAPLALFLLLWPPGALGYFARLSLPVWALLLCAGALTSCPLYLFAQGVKLLPLSAVGFIQFVSPTLTLLSGVFILKEPFPARSLLPFGCIWASVLLYSASLLRRKKV